MTAVLILEIVSALVALLITVGMAAAFLVNTVRNKQMSSKKRHKVLSIVLVSAACIHGVAATVYASGAHGATYACGWAAAALLCIAGAIMISPRADREKRKPLHIVLFFAAVACVIVHIVFARM